jgi:hypothetical protein
VLLGTILFFSPTPEPRRFIVQKFIATFLFALVSFFFVTGHAAAANCKLTHGAVDYDTHLKADTKKCGTDQQSSIDLKWYQKTGNPTIEKSMKAGCAWKDITGIAHKVEQLADICTSVPRHAADLADPIKTLAEASSDDGVLKWIVPPEEKGGIKFNENALRDTLFKAFDKCGEGADVACKPIFEKEVKVEQQTVIGNARIRVCQNAFSTLRKPWVSGIWTTDTGPVPTGGLMIFCNVPRPTAVATAGVASTRTSTKDRVTPKDEVVVPAKPNDGAAHTTRVTETKSPDLWVQVEIHAATSIRDDGNSRSTLLVAPYLGFGLGLDWPVHQDWRLALTLTWDREKLHTPVGIAPTYWGVRGSLTTEVFTPRLRFGPYLRVGAGYSDTSAPLSPHSTQLALGGRAEFAVVHEACVSVRLVGQVGFGAESSAAYRYRGANVPPWQGSAGEWMLGASIVFRPW